METSGMRGSKGLRFRSSYEAQPKGKGKVKTKSKFSKGKTKKTLPVDWSKGQGKPKGKVNPQTNPKGKGYTAEEANLPDTETQDNQWQEPNEPSYDTWQTKSQTWDWNADTTWDDSEAHYQEWDASPDWQSKSGWFAEQVSSGPECRASGQDSGLLQLFV